MKKKLEINDTYMPHSELKKLYTKRNDAKLKIKLLAILMTWDGKTSLEVAATLTSQILQYELGYTDITNAEYQDFQLEPIATVKAIYPL